MKVNRYPGDRDVQSFCKRRPRSPRESTVMPAWHTNDALPPPPNPYYFAKPSGTKFCRRGCKASPPCPSGCASVLKTRLGAPSPRAVSLARPYGSCVQGIRAAPLKGTNSGEDPGLQTATEYSNMNWHRWFAWHPIDIDYKRHWLTYVERKWDMGDKTGEALWRYRIASSNSR